MPAAIAAPPVFRLENAKQPALPLCSLANPWFEEDPEWSALAVEIYTGTPDSSPNAVQRLYGREGLTNRKKLWETTHIAYGLQTLGVLDGATVGLGIACGTEPLIYHFARHTARLFASDMYGFGWDCAPFAMLTEAERYAPYSYPAHRLSLLQMHASALLMPDNSMDFVYSVSSIEHFGGTKAALAHLREANRVLKPGGILAFSTEMIIYGGSAGVAPEAKDFFTRTTLEWLILNSDMERVAPLELTPSRDLLENAAPIRLPNWDIAPEHFDRLSCRLRDTVYTDVTVFLRKR